MALVSHARWHLLYRCRNREREKLGAAVPSGDFAEERVGVGGVDDDWQEVPDLAGIAVEDDDAVAVGATGELKMGARGWGLGTGLVVRVCVPLGCFAGAFDQDLDLPADEGVVVFFADLVLQ